MGRKPKAAKLETISCTPEKSSPITMEKLVPKRHKNSTNISPRKKASKYTSLIVRRSGRLRNLVQPARNQETDPVVEEINLVDSEREGEPHVEEHTLEPIPAAKSEENKIDHLVEIVEELKSKNTELVTTGHFSSGDPSTDLKNKSLYIESQKKIEALTNENYQLTRKLEIALAKLEAYENMKEVMEKLKDAILISNLTKATEAVVNLSSRAMFDKLSSPVADGEPDTAFVTPQSPAKRKRCHKGSEKN